MPSFRKFFLNLQLKTEYHFQKYYVTLEAGTTAGTVNVSSDGVQVLDINRKLTGIVLRDGTNCSSKFLIFAINYMIKCECVCYAFFWQWKGIKTWISNLVYWAYLESPTI